MALNILDLPDRPDGTREYMVGEARLLVSTVPTPGGVTRVERMTGARGAVEGSWLNDTEAIEAFHGEFPLF